MTTPNTPQHTPQTRATDTDTSAVTTTTPSSEVATRTRRHEGRSLTFRPAYDVRETAKGYVVTADMPGVSAETLEISVEDQQVRLHGRVQHQQPEGFDAEFTEYEVGDFEQVFAISSEIDVERIEARMNDGVLTLTLPKHEKASRRINVTAG